LIIPLHFEPNDKQSGFKDAHQAHKFAIVLLSPKQLEPMQVNKKKAKKGFIALSVGRHGQLLERSIGRWDATAS
jgi:hypothetical protein